MIKTPCRIPRVTCRLIMLGTIVVFCLGLAGATPAAAAKRVAIISIDDESSTQRTVKGIKKSLDRSGFEISYHEVILSGHEESDSRSFSELRKFSPHLFITIGSYATRAISLAFPDRVIIFANVMNPMASGFVASMSRPGGRITGAALDIPCDMQFNYFRRVVGDIRNLGVIYSSETANIIEEGKMAARSHGINLIPVMIDSEKEIPQAIDSVCRVSDALWSVADHTVYTPQSTRHIILQTLRNQIPMMGFSRSLVEAGGLFTLDFDFKDIGSQAGEIASRVLKGKDPADIPVSTPGVIYFKYNEQTAQQINIDIPEDLLAIAKEVLK